jgi:hypothetical protein
MENGFSDFFQGKINPLTTSTFRVTVDQEIHPAWLSADD